MKTLAGPLYHTLLIFCLISLSVLYSCQKDEGNIPKDVLDTKLFSFTPAAGKEGSTVLIRGLFFSSNMEKNIVKFNGVTAQVLAVNHSRTELTVTVPAGAKSGKITVEVSGNTVTTKKDFIVDPSAPTIASLLPDHGDAGTVVEILGSHFEPGAKVFFNGIEATDVSIVSSIKIKAKVPVGAMTGKVKLVNNGFEALSPGNFYMKPAITTITTSAEEGEEVVVIGTNFSTIVSDMLIRFGGGSVLPSEIISISETEIKVKAPVGGNNGKVEVLVKGQSALSVNDFTYKSKILDFSPKHGERGTVVTLTGKRLHDNPLIQINNITAPITSKSATQITFTVPGNDAVTGGKISLIGNGNYETTLPFEVTNIWIERFTGTLTSAHSSGVCVAYNGKIYLGLGRTPSDNYLNYFMVYDPATNTWSNGPVIPAGMSGRVNAVAIVSGDKMYVGTGFNPNESPADKNDWWSYDFITNSWQSLTPHPSAGSSRFVFSMNGKIYVGPSGTTGDIFAFDPHAGVGGTWTSQSALLGTLISGTSFMINNVAYIGGGQTALSSASPKFNRITFASNTGTITPIIDCPIGMDRPSSFTKDSKGYVVTQGSGRFFEYTPTLNIWSELHKLPNASNYRIVNASGRAFAVQTNGSIYEYRFRH